MWLRLNKRLEYEGRTVIFPDGKAINLGDIVKAAYLIGDKVIVLFSWSEHLKEKFDTLIAYSKDGERLWAAKPPTQEENDGYTAILPTKFGLWAYSWSGYECKIDVKSGRVKRRVFTK